MSSKTEKQTLTKGDVATISAAALATPAPTPKILKVKQGLKFRGAREAWYQQLVAHDGKTQEEFLKATALKPPSLTKKNEAEKPSGWLSFFLRTQAASLVDAA